MKSGRFEIVVNNVFSGNVFAIDYEIYKQNEFHGIVKGDIEFSGLQLFDLHGDVVYFIDGCLDVRLDGNVFYIER